MKRQKPYARTIFDVSVLRRALEHLGSVRKLQMATVKRGGIEVTYDDETQFLDAYRAGFEGCLLMIDAGPFGLWVSSSSGTTTVEIRAPNEKALDGLFGEFDAAAAPAATAEPAELVRAISLQRCCVYAALNWKTLPALADQLLKYEIQIERIYVTIRRFPDSVSYSDWEPALSDVAENGDPRRYSVRWSGDGPAGRFTCALVKSSYTDTNQPFVLVEFDGLPDIRVADDVVAFLGLEADKPSPVALLPRSAFIAHRFDTEGEQVADRLARFLDLLGFDVKTGRGFAPEAVSEKVRKRIESQAVIFIVYTPGDDATWLIQESVLALAREKCVFLLRDPRVAFKSALFGDLEYITFESPNIERAFIPVLEGLRTLGFLSFGDH